MQMKKQVLCFCVAMLLPLCLCQISLNEIQHHQVRHHRNHNQHHKRHAHSEVQHVREVIVARNDPAPETENLDSHDLQEAQEKMSQDESSSSQSEMDVDYYHKIVENLRTSTEKSTSSCPKCQQNSVKVSEESLTELRIEFVKNQILQKLRLTERPPQSLLIDALPKPIADGDTIQMEIDEKPDPRLDDFYAKTTQKIIFLTREFVQCKKLNEESPSVCFLFDIPGDMDATEVETAQLWIYEKPNQGDEMNQTFIISDIEYWDKDQKFPKTHPLAIKDTAIEEGWVRIDINWPVKQWVQSNKLRHIIQITCKTCDIRIHQPVPISVKNERKPFIVIDTFPKRKVNRQARSVNCAPGIKECCREKMYISFADIGWDDWIIHPPGYDAYFCRGACTSTASITMSGSNYNSVIRKVMFKQKQGGSSNTKNLELIPCCTAARYSSLQLFYMDSNNTATQKTLPNMVVEACGCH